MIRRLVLLTALAVLATANYGLADVVTNFSDITLAPDSFLNNTIGSEAAPSSGSFQSGGNSFNNRLDIFFGFPSWTGWAISNKINPPTLPSTGVNDFQFQYQAITGGGAPLSTTPGQKVAGIAGDPFGIALSFTPKDAYINLAPGTAPKSVQVTNSLYTWLSMTYGDGFGSQFGVRKDDDGNIIQTNVPDYFRMTIQGFSGADGTGVAGNTVEFYLADFRDPSNAYILDQWQTLDLTSLAGSASLAFGFDSFDVGPFGMNTPAYVALDNLVVAPVPEPSSLLLTAVLAGAAGAARWRRRFGFGV